MLFVDLHCSTFSAHVGWLSKAVGHEGGRFAHHCIGICNVYISVYFEVFPQGPWGAGKTQWAKYGIWILPSVFHSPFGFSMFTLYDISPYAWHSAQCFHITSSRHFLSSGAAVFVFGSCLSLQGPFLIISLCQCRQCVFRHLSQIAYDGRCFWLRCGGAGWSVSCRERWCVFALRSYASFSARQRTQRLLLQLMQHNSTTPAAGLEPTTTRLRALRSTDWTRRAPASTRKRKQDVINKGDFFWLWDLF